MWRNSWEHTVTKYISHYCCYEEQINENCVTTVIFLFNIFVPLRPEFSLSGFHSDCIRQKRECSPSVDWTEIFWPQAKKNCIIAKHVHTRRFAFSIVCSSFDSGPCVACLVRMWDEVLLLNNWDNNCLFCSRTRLWIAMALRWVNSRNSHISLATISLRLLT